MPPAAAPSIPASRFLIRALSFIAFLQYQVARGPFPVLLASVAGSFNEHERHAGFIIANGFAFSTHGLLQANAKVSDDWRSSNSRIAKQRGGPSIRSTESQAGMCFSHSCESAESSLTD